MASSSLLVVPTPFLDESVTSWLLRTAAFHDTTVRTMLPFFDKGDAADYDRNFSEANLGELLFGIPAECRYRSILVDGWGLLKLQGWQRTFIRETAGGIHCTGVCPLCLQDDEPYWKIPWRLKFYVACEKHRCPLKFCCERCSAPIGVSRGRGSAFHQLQSTISLLRHCRVCGCDLAEIVEDFSKNFPLEKILQLQRAMVSALHHGYLKIDNMDGHLDVRNIPKILIAGCRPDGMCIPVGFARSLSLSLNSRARFLLYRYKKEPFTKSTESITDRELSWLVDYSINLRFSRFCSSRQALLCPSLNHIWQPFLACPSL